MKAPPRKTRRAPARPRVAFLGPEGTFSELAARHAFGEGARYLPLPSVHAVFEAVAERTADRGVVPVENSTEGSVTLSTDALLEGKVKLERELILSVDLVLMSQAPRLARVKRVHSHPQALAQCRAWLARNLPQAEVVATASTAAAARLAAQDPTCAAVGSELAAKANALPVRARRIQDRPGNSTRFLVLGRKDAPPTGADKTTLAFSVPHRRGALRRVLSVFEDAGVNLCRIESRPAGERAWEYVFLVDVEGHRRDEAVARALRALATVAERVAIFGSYPRATSVKTSRASRRAT